MFAGWQVVIGDSTLHQLFPNLINCYIPISMFVINDMSTNIFSIILYMLLTVETNLWYLLISSRIQNFSI